MKANELRIGNKVKVNGLYNGQILTYDRFNEEKDVMFFSDGNKFGMGEFLHNIEPIQLTEEILLKCGFEKNGIRYSKNDIYLWIDENKIVFAIAELKSKTGKYLEIESFHQLQNLYFALTGEELTIDISQSKTTE